MPDQREEVLNFIKYNGPVLPVQIAKHVNTNILFASAILSELVSRKLLKITSASIGGSPIYYLTGQEDRMDERLSKSLSGKEKEAYQLLKEKKVVRETDLEPWQRVAIKGLKDFAVQINVKDRGNSESFWKHNLVTDEEAKLIISEIMDEVYSEQENSQEIVNNVIEDKIEPVVAQEVISNNQPSNALQAQLTDQLLGTKPKIEREVNPIKQKERIVQESLIPESPKLKEVKKEKKIDTKFYSRVLDFMKENNVDVLKEEVVKKDKEIDFVVSIPTGFGRLKYLVKAKNKPAINEADVSMAFSEGQIKKMPVIMLINGKANKKASLLVEQKMQGQLTLKEI